MLVLNRGGRVREVGNLHLTKVEYVSGFGLIVTLAAGYGVGGVVSIVKNVGKGELALFGLILVFSSVICKRTYDTVNNLLCSYTLRCCKIGILDLNFLKCFLKCCRIKGNVAVKILLGIIEGRGAANECRQRHNRCQN